MGVAYNGRRPPPWPGQLWADRGREKERLGQGQGQGQARARAGEKERTQSPRDVNFFYVAVVT